MGILDGLDLDDSNDRREAVQRYSSATAEWAQLCQRHQSPSLGGAVTSDPAVASEAEQMVANIEEANRLLNEAFERALRAL